MAAPLTCYEELLAEELRDYRSDDLAAGSLCVVRGGFALLEATVLSGQPSHADGMAPRDVEVPDDGGCLDVKPIGVSGGVLARDARLNVVCERGALYYTAVLEVSREAVDENVCGNPCDGRHPEELINAPIFQFNMDSLPHLKSKKINAN